MRLTSVALLAPFLFAGCASVPVNAQYRSFGVPQPELDAKFIETYESEKNIREQRLVEHGESGRVKPPDGIMVLVDTIPEGLEVTNSGIHVLPGYSFEILGRAALRRSRAGDIGVRALIDEFKFLAQKTGATLVLMSLIERTYGASQDDVDGGVAVFVRGDTSKIDAKKSIQKKLPVNEL